MTGIQFIEVIAQGLVQVENCVSYLRRQNLHAGLRRINILSKQIIQIVEQIVGQAAVLRDWGYEVDINYITSIVSGITNAQEQQDYILVADLLELQLRPLLLQLQEVLIANCDTLLRQDLLEVNLEGFSLKDKGLVDKIRVHDLGEACVVEPTSSGLLTMAVTDDTGTYYFHSNVNPVTEGRMFAEEYYSIEHSHYVVFGLGLGYHIKALLALDDGIYVDIIEPDMEIIKTAFSVMDMTWLNTNPRVRLIWDAGCQKWQELLKEQQCLVIHYPSLRHIKDTNIKLQMEKFFIHDSGIRNMRIQLENNFRDNIINCSEYVDVLKPEFQGKNAVIVAAGPSLDKNVELLKNKPEDTVVVAVGTVFRKLVNLGIRPDYVVFLDAQPHLYGMQLKGLEDMDISIICASTACKQIAAQYQGKKYLICQQGYDRAERYASEKGFQTYETGGSVSTIALDLCIRMGCKSIAYIGLDLAFTENQSHAVDTACYVEESENDKIMIPAIGGGMVPASRVFILYREWIERRAARESGKIQIIDATEGGALKKGLQHKTLKETFSLWSKQ